MDDGVFALVVLVVLAVAVAALLVARRRRTARPRLAAPGHDRTVDAGRSQLAAEQEPRQREQRRERIELVPLEEAARDRYLDTWHRAQALFVDAPREATRQADRLVTEVMRERGYPVEDFELRAGDLSVDDPRLVQDYRTARAIAGADDRSEARTEDLRQALVHYRSLLEELLDAGGATWRASGRTD